MTLSLVVAVYLLQFFVESLRKSLHRRRFFSKLYHPLVTTFCIVIHEYRCRSVFQYLCSRLFTGIFKSLFCVVNNKFLSKGIDKVFRSSGDDELIRVDRCEAYRVAYHIAPQSA